MGEIQTTPHISETRLEQKIQWEIETDVVNEVDKYEEKLKEMLIQNGWNEDEVFRLTLTFREWLINAMIHGNMGPLNKQELGDDNWYEVLESRQNQAQAEGKKVLVSGEVNPSRVEIRIQDQGKQSKEFWLEHRRSPVDEGLMDTSNRGWYLAEHFTNSISFKKNGQGVEVTIIRDKNLPLKK
jgi:anti-sigma regulatory factor (Ser/Thr protein kinase)